MLQFIQNLTYKEDNMTKITLPSGVVVEGVSEETLKNILSGLEDGVHYKSSTRGRIKIAEMTTPHLRNALLKALRDSLENAKTLPTIELINYLKTGIGTDSITTIAMVKELTGRKD